jgi:hypothetical protein
MEKSELLRYEIYLRDDTFIMVKGEEKGLRLQQAVCDKDTRFVKIDDQIIAISEIRKIVEIKSPIDKKFRLPEEAEMTETERKMKLERIEKIKQDIVNKLRTI